MIYYQIEMIVDPEGKFIRLTNQGVQQVDYISKHYIFNFKCVFQIPNIICLFFAFLDFFEWMQHCTACWFDESGQL